MVNRIVKESIYGNTNSLIKKILFYDEEVTFQEIRKYLEERDIVYKYKRGLYSRLNKLIDEGVVIKINYKIPKYCLSGKGRKDPVTLGIMLKYEMIDQLEFFKIKLKQNDYWKFMTSLIGFYSVYAEILSWQLFKNEKSLEKRLRSQKEFLQNALPLKIFEGDWNQSIEIFGRDKISKNINELSLEFKEFSKTLEKSNSLMYNLCENVTTNISEKILRMKEFST